MNWREYRPKEFIFSGRNIHNWFSNMIPCSITIDDITYNSTENYYQAMKSDDPEVHKLVAVMSPHKSKVEGTKIKKRPDWDDIKYNVMKTGLLAKWTQEPWKQKLLDTKNEMIIEWNNWGDKFWGVSIYDNKGNNWLGKALMEIRDGLQQKETKVQNWFTK